MTQNPTADRPPQVTVAGWVTIAGSLFLVLGMFDQIARLRSIDSREAIAKALAEPPLDGLGLGLDGALSVLHTVFVIAGALGAAACVLGWFVLQRHKQARLALSVVAVPLFFSGFASGSIAASFVAVSAMLLWSGPARDWFAGRPVRQPPMLVAPVQRPPTAPPAPPAGPPVGPPTGPPAVPPEAGDRVDAPHLPPVPTGVASTAPPPYAGFGAPRPASAYAPPARPRALVSALVITWVTSALVAAVTCMFLLAMLAEPDLFRQMVARDPQLTELGLSLAELRSLAVATSLVCLGWALVAAFLALLVMMRVTWARPALIASAVISGLISCFAFAAVAPLVTAVAGMVTAYLLLRPEVAQWVNRR